jgi:succinate dehydrogenase flavin-adding protein (antitoxin of CptAB toxin-antitoxin module)
VDDVSPAPEAAPSSAAKANEPNWGLLEPIRGLLGPVADIIDPLFDSKVITAILFILLMWSWFFKSSAPSLSHPHTPAQRLAAYEQIWQTEEAELWKWMEERVALDRVHEAAMGRKIQQSSEMKEALKGDAAKAMGERQVDEAIRVTEERLEALKYAVKRERGKGKENSTKK